MPTRDDDHPRIRPAPPHVPGGVVAVVGVPAVENAVADGTLHDEEAALARTMTPSRRATFIAGRRALRAAVGGVDATRAASPLLRNPRGRPLLPSGLIGSVSHKRSRAVAIAAHSTSEVVSHVGIDLESRPSARDLERPSIAPRILTSRELDAVEQFAAGDRLRHRERTLLHFAIKEAVYKTIDPWVERYVRFTEVELALRDDRDDRDDGDEMGVAAVRLLLPEPDAATIMVSARWEFDDEWIVATAISTIGAR